MIYRSLDLLYPQLAQEVIEVVAYSGLSVFETWRSPLRQASLNANNTDAEAWKSWHQYGLAFDVAEFDGKEWSWDLESRWIVIGEYGKSLGLEWGGDFKRLKDYGHFQYPTKGLTVHEAYEIQKKEGVLGVWAEIERREAADRGSDG